MDEKGGSALLVWGVEGGSHESSDTVFALHAAIKIRDDLQKLKTNPDFSIGVSSGVWFVF